MIRIRRGLDIPLPGAPDTNIVAPGPTIRRVAIVGDDIIGLHPSVDVEVGDRVRLGQPLIHDRKHPGIRLVAPGSGEVEAIHRGDRRHFQSLVIRLEAGADGADENGDDRDDPLFPALGDELPEPDALRERLVESGLLTAFRTRPHSRVPQPDQQPQAIFVTAIDTNPLAPDPAVAIRSCEADFVHGLRVLTRLTSTVHLCMRPGSGIPTADGIRVHEFAGPHPAGLPGTHIHFVQPAHESRTVWHIGDQDVAALGFHFRTGGFRTDRVVSLGGPLVEHPRVVATRIGASTRDLLHDNVDDRMPGRVVSGSILSGRAARGPYGFLGRYHQQVTVVPDATDRPFLGWLRPGVDRFSATRAFASTMLRRRQGLRFHTGLRGEQRAILPIGTYEKVLPLDLVITPLLKAIEVGDVDRAIGLGVLELDEEDLALCSFVCPGKIDFGAHLRQLLDRIAEEG